MSCPNFVFLLFLCWQLWHWIRCCESVWLWNKVSGFQSAIILDLWGLYTHYYMCLFCWTPICCEQCVRLAIRVFQNYVVQMVNFLYIQYMDFIFSSVIQTDQKYNCLFVWWQINILTTITNPRQAKVDWLKRFNEKSSFSLQNHIFSHNGEWSTYIGTKNLICPEAKTQPQISLVKHTSEESFFSLVHKFVSALSHSDHWLSSPSETEGDGKSGGLRNSRPHGNIPLSHHKHLTSLKKTLKRCLLLALCEQKLESWCLCTNKAHLRA